MKDNLSKKEKRLVIELVRQHIPLRHNDNDILAAWIKDELNLNITEDDIKKIPSFKQITKKKVITMNNENVKIINRLRWRNRDQVQKNIIHFQI